MQFPDFTFVSCYRSEAVGDGKKGGRRDDDALGEQEKVSVSWLLQTPGSAAPGHARAVLLHTPGTVTRTHSHSSSDKSQAPGAHFGNDTKKPSLHNFCRKVSVD